MPTAPLMSELMDASSLGNATPSAISKSRGKRPLDLDERSKTIKPSELNNNMLTLKKKASELQMLGGDDVNVVVILQRKMDRKDTWKHEVVGGRSKEEAEDIVLTTAQIFRHKRQDDDKGERYMKTKGCGSFTVLDASTALKESESEKSSKRIKNNRPKLCDITSSSSSVVQPLPITPSGNVAVQLFADTSPALLS